MKKCNKCFIEKELIEFSKTKNKYSKDGHNWTCKICCRDSAKQWADENKEKKNEYLKEYAIVNKEKIKAWRKESRKRNREARNEYNRQWNEHNRQWRIEWEKKNPDKIKHHRRNILAKRRALKKNAFPKWLTKDQRKEIRIIYEECVQIEMETGIKHNVDHIVPLVSKLVCGLHVPWNLQILTATENKKKSNKL